MPERPFREKGQSKQARAAGESRAKSEFEDKVRQENQDILDKFKQLSDKMLNPKVEKDEQAEKYAKDYADIQKNTKDSKDSKDNKHEKLEKERKDYVKESDVGVLQAPAIASDPRIEQRIAALEDIVGRLAHFIPSEARPELSRGALTEEPDQPSKGRKRA